MQPDTPLETQGVLNDAETQKAKDWFDNQIRLEKQTASLSILDSFNVQPLWAQALSFKNNNRFEMPYLLKGKMIRASDSRSNDTSRFSKSVLIMYKNGNQGYKAYLFDFIPSKDYVGKKGDISPDNLKKMKFSGSVLVSDVKRQNTAVYIFKDGKKQAFRKLKRRSTNTLIPRDEHCSTVYTLLGCSFHELFINGTWVRYMGDCDYLEENICYDDGFCSYCPIEPYYTDTYTDAEMLCAACDFFFTPINRNPTTVTQILKQDDLKNQLQNPCNSSVMNQIRSTSSLSEINGFLNTFQTDPNTHFLIKDAYLPNSNDGETIFKSATNTNEITLNRNVMDNASKEYIAVTIMHEILHAYLGSYLGVQRGNTPQHERMTEDLCVDFLVTSLIQLFPNLSPADAQALAWYGFDSTPRWNEFNLAQKYEMQTINDKYKTHELGTPCQ